MNKQGFIKSQGLTKAIWEVILGKVFEAWKATFVSKDGHNVADGLMAVASSIDKVAEKLPKK